MMMFGVGVHIALIPAPHLWVAESSCMIDIIGYQCKTCGAMLLETSTGTTILIAFVVAWSFSVVKKDLFFEKMTLLTLLCYLKHDNSHL